MILKIVIYNGCTAGKGSALVQFHIKASRWQSSTISVGIMTQLVSRRINVSIHYGNVDVCSFAPFDDHMQLWMDIGDNISQFLPAATPTITNPLVFTQGSPSSSLNCTTTTSIATNVTFMREGNAINGIVRDGNSATVNGVTYQLSQTLTDRAQSTYDNVLTITEALSSLAGSTFTCQVENALGVSAISQSIAILGKRHGLGMYSY